MRVLGELARAYGDGTVRVTPDQNLVFRWVNACDVRQLYKRVAAAGLGLAEAGNVADVASCPGAESCRLAVTQSRGLGRLLEDQLRARPDLIAEGRRRAHQDQRLPERLRPASHRDDRLPGQRAPARRPRRAAVLRDGRRRRDRARRQLRPAGGQGAGAPDARGRRAADRAVRARETNRTRRRPNSSAASRSSASSWRCCRSSSSRAEDAVPEDYIDLAEAGEFAPVVMDGECSA